MRDAAASKAAREEGNALFRRGKWSSAAAAYSRAIAADETDPLPFSNRAMAWLKLERYPDAEADATEAIKLDPGNVKAMYRRAVARRGLGRLDAAADDLRSVLRMEENAAARDELGEIETHMAQMGVGADVQEKENKEKVEVSVKVTEKPQATDKVPSEEEETAPAAAETTSAIATSILSPTSTPTPAPAAPTPVPSKASFAALRGKRDARKAYVSTSTSTASSTPSTSTASAAPVNTAPSISTTSVAPRSATDKASASPVAVARPPSPPSAPAPTPAPAQASKSAARPPNPTSTAPGSGLALLHALRALPAPERWSYFRAYNAAIVPVILGRVLEPDGVGMVLATLDSGLGSSERREEDGEWARRVLEGLRRTPRWGMNVAMLTPAEREAGMRAWAAVGGEGGL